MRLPSGFSQQPLEGIKDDDGMLKKSFMWMGGDNGERTLQSLNFPGLGMDPWMQMQHKFESPLSGMQPDVYQAMAAAALQEIRSVDPSKQLLQFQSQQPVQSQQLQCMAQPLLQRQIIQQQQQHIGQQQVQNLQQQQPQQHILQQQAQTLQQQQPQQHILHHQAQNMPQQQPQNHLLQQQLQQQSSQHQILQQLQHSYNEQQLPSSQQLQCQQQTFKISNVAGALSQPPTSQSQSSISLPSSVCSQAVFADSNANLASPGTSSSTSPLQSILRSLASEENSHYSNLPRASQPSVQQPARTLTGTGLPQDRQIPSTSWFSSKRASNNQLVSCLGAGQVEAPLPSASQRVLSQTEPLAQSNIPVQSMPLTQFALRNCSSDQEGVQSDSQSNLLFGVNIDTPSLVITDTVSNSRNIGNGAYVGSSFSVTDLLNVPSCAPTSGFPMNSSIGASGGLDESGFLRRSMEQIMHTLIHPQEPSLRFTS